MSVTDGRVLRGTGTDVGSRGRERLALGPFKWDVEFEIAEAISGRRIVWRSVAGAPFDIEISLDLVAVGPINANYHLPHMADDARIDAGGAYRGFLFSDVRGFTAFAERHGNAAAAAMVSRFLEIARKAIARHGGGETKTEGDAIHAVFPSASSAVLCGLEIVDAAAELNAQEPQRPLGLGVGVHAGEAVETADGYIGRAVNIAARLCADAKPGEVLVSSTVKGIMQASVPVGFIPRGRRRLKGIQDPILVYAVSRDVSARAPREVPRPVIVGAAGVAAAVVLGIAAIAGSQFLSNPTASPLASAAPTTQPVAIGRLPFGTYTSGQFQPPFTFTIVDQGWSANRDLADVVGLIRDVPPLGSVYVMRVDDVITNPCVEESESFQTGPGGADVIGQLEALAVGHLTLENRTPVEVGGVAGQQVDVTVAEGALAACGGLAGGQVAVVAAGDEVWKAVPGERFRLVSVTVDGQAVTILISTDWEKAPTIQDFEDLMEQGGRVIESVRF